MQQVSGQPFPEYVKENIFDPLGMTNTHFSENHAAIVLNRAAGYNPVLGDDGLEFQNAPDLLDLVGDGNLFTTVEDLYRWDQNFYDQKIGDAEFLELMQAKGVLNDGSEIPYAAGLIHLTHKDLETIGHSGFFYGFSSEMVRFPGQDFTVICLCNRSDLDPEALTRRVADIYLIGE